MKLAMRLAPKPDLSSDLDRDPREDESAEIIDLASRTAYPAVSQRRGKSDALGLASGVAIVAVLGLATLWGMNSTRLETDPPHSPRQQARAPAAPLEQRATNAFLEASAPTTAPGQASLADPGPSAVLASPPQAAYGPVANRYNSPTVVFDSSSLDPVAAPGATAPVDPGDSTVGDFASRIGGVGGGRALARSDVDPKTTVTQGTMIPAVLETAINTDVPGYVRAVVSQDVRSFDGTRVLVPRSSRLIGQYQSGLQAGQRRAYVIWTRLIRPDGVSVALASPATGFDGTAGLEGKVDSHFFQRFGSAMLLSVIGGLTAVASGGTSVILGGGQSAASTALQQDGQRAPTVRVGMGTPVRVYTARDLDFSQAPRL